MHPYGQQCKQPCLPPPLCQQKTWIKGTPLCLPPSQLQKNQTCAPQWHSQACQQQTHKPSAHQWPRPCYPQQCKQSPQQCVQVCAPQWQKGHSPTCIQQSGQSRCKSASFAPQQSLGPLAVQPCVPKGKGSQQRISQDSQQCVKGVQLGVTKGGPVYASQPCMTKGGPGYITKGNRQYTSQQCITKGCVEGATKSGRQWTAQPCVKKGGPACATKGSWEYTGKGSSSQQCKSQVKMSSSGQKYCSAGGWPW